MFCPRCSAQNKLEQKFCRNCGLSLPSVRLALEGKVDEAAADLKRSYEQLGPGIWMIWFFMLAALINAFLWDWGVVVNLVLGFLITLRWFLRGFKQFENVMKRLEGKEAQSEGPAIAPAERTAVQAESAPQPELAPAPAADTDPILMPPAQGSIAEHTTYELKQPEPRQ